MTVGPWPAVCWVVKAWQPNAGGFHSLAATRKTHFSGGEPMTEKKDETVYDRIRREEREKQEAEKERQRRVDQWANQDNPVQDVWNRGGQR